MRKPKTRAAIAHNAAYDIFISYKWDRAYDAHVENLHKELTTGDSALSVFLDRSEGSPFTGISEEVENALGNSRLILVWYSKKYNESIPCRAELVSALSSILQSRRARDRIAIVQPDDQPRPDVSILKDLKAESFKIADPQVSTSELALVIKSHLNQNVPRSPIRRDSSQRLTQWYPGQRTARLTHLTRWEYLLDILSRVSEKTISQSFSPHAGLDITCLTGLSGIGKTSLAQDFATRFASLFPAGIYWVSARTHALGSQERYGALTSQLAGIARSVLKNKVLRTLDLGSREAIIGALRRNLSNTKGFMLLIVDNWPTDAGHDELYELALAFPSERLRILVTTQDRSLTSVGKSVEVRHLSTLEAKSLLASMRRPYDADDERSCDEVIKRLEGHPTALQVVGSALRYEPVPRAYQRWQAKLDTVGSAALEAALVFDGPNGPEDHSLARSLWAVFESLTNDERAVLRVASWLANAPFTPQLLQAPLWGIRYDNAFLGMRIDFHAGLDVVSHCIASLSRLSIFTATGTASNMWELHQLVARIFRESDMDKRAALNCRDNLTNLLAAALRETEAGKRLINSDVAVSHAFAVAATQDNVPGGYLLHALGDYYGRRGKLSLQGECYRLSVSLCERFSGESITLYPYLVVYARSCIQRRDYTGAVNATRRAVKILEYSSDFLDAELLSQQRAELELDLAYALAATGPHPNQ